MYGRHAASFNSQNGAKHFFYRGFTIAAGYGHYRYGKFCPPVRGQLSQSQITVFNDDGRRQVGRIFFQYHPCRTLR